MTVATASASLASPPCKSGISLGEERFEDPIDTLLGSRVGPMLLPAIPSSGRGLGSFSVGSLLLGKNTTSVAVEGWSPMFTGRSTGCSPESFIMRSAASYAVLPQAPFGIVSMSVRLTLLFAEIMWALA